MLVVGVTDALRQIVGVDDLENRMKHIRSTIEKYIEPRRDLIHLQQVLIQSDAGEHKSCVVIAITQTRDVVSARDKQGRYTYPVRLATGLEYSSQRDIVDRKRGVLNDNFDFIKKLDRYVHDI